MGRDALSVRCHATPREFDSLSFDTDTRWFEHKKVFTGSTHESHCLGLSTVFELAGRSPRRVRHSPVGPDSTSISPRPAARHPRPGDSTPPVLTPQIETRQTPPPAAPTYGIPQAQIQKQGAESLAETLRGLPGFAINDVGPAADIHTGSYYRGASINQSAVLLNGRPLGTNVNTYHGTTDFNSIAVESIEKVELSSGSSSTLHGTEAVGGVVNLVTKKGRGAPRLSTSVEYGSLGQANYRSSYSGAGEQVSYNLSYQSFLADNRYAVPVGAANRDPATGLLFNGDTYRNSYFASVSYEPDSRNTISFDLTKFISRRGLLYFGFPLQRDRLDHDGLNAGLSWRHLLGGGEDSILKTTVGFNQDFFNTYGPSGNFNRTGTVDTKQLSVRVEHEWFTSPNHNLRYGFDGLNTRLNGEALSTVPTQVAFNDREDRSVFNGALFALSAWNITPSLQLETGSRLTFNGLFGNYFNPSGGLRWTLDRAVTLRASVASVQRNPGLDQLFLYDVVHTWLPNSDLRPETGASYSAGLDVQFSPA